jgi:hypothetical protein
MKVVRVAKMKILVVGSKGHKRAHCVDWLEPFPNIEEYDSVIINLQSLTQEIFDKIYPKISLEMRKEIATLFDTDREVFCIINQYMIPSTAPGQGKGYVRPPPTNYDWLPAIVSTNVEKPGTSIALIDKRFEKYLEKVEQWSFILDLYKEPPFEKAVQQTYAELARLIGDVAKILRFQLLPIAENKSRKTIAGTLLYQGKKGKGAIHLLPPPTKCDVYEAIEILLDLVYGQPAKTYPPWREEIEIPGVKDILKQINKKFQDIKKIQESIAILQRRAERFDAFRDLLSASGEDLERAVERTLTEIGISTQKTEKGFPADLISKEVAVEVTGIKGPVTVSSEKVNQIARFKESFQKKQKMILIANTYMDVKPSDRRGKMNFTREVDEYLKSIGVSCMTSQTLFELWKDVKTSKGKARNVVNTILKHNGELTLEDFG